MIQRPQSLYLCALLVICLMLILGDIVYFKASNSDKSESVNIEYDETELIAADGTSKQQNTLLISLLASIGAIATIAIFLFKNRKMQILLSSVNYLFILGLILIMYMASYRIGFFEQGTEGLTFYALMPVALLFFNFLAIRGITKDEKLIRSMDRLR